MSTQEKMKLSTAIREGIKLDGKQIQGSFFQYDGNGNVIGCCAFGAAAIGAGFKPARFKSDPNASIMDYLIMDYLAQHTNYNDICRDRTLKFIVDLNDREGLTREQIADYLEGLGY